MAETYFAYETLLHFLNEYFIEENVQKLLDMVTGDIYCIGVPGENPVFNREDFEKMLRRYMRENPNPSFAVYELSGYREKKLGEETLLCYCEAETYMNIDGEKLNLACWEITLGVQREGQTCKLEFIHLSEIKNWIKRGEALRRLYPEGTDPFMKSLYQYLEESSLDSLTNLYNRKAGESLISRALENGGKYIFLLMDIDNFKAINDVYGHLKGDAALKYVADKIRKSFRTTDVMFRLGGDEFVVFIYPCKECRAIERKLDKIIEDYGRNIHALFPLISSALSWGGVFSSKRRTFTELYQKADTIMYQVKKQGGKGYQIEED